MRLKSHQTSEVPQWELEGAKPWNRSQRAAAKSRGFATLANVATVAGGVSSIVGIHDISQGRKVRGGIKLLFGGLLDRVDGSIAELTETKSPVGEGFDATTDKVALGYTLVLLEKANMVPRKAAIAMGAHSIVNAGLGVTSMLRHRKVHPGWPGKITMGLQRAAPLLYVGESIAHDHGQEEIARWLGRAANVTTVASLAVGAVATAQYAYGVLGPLTEEVVAESDHIERLGEISSVNGSDGAEPSIA